MVQGFISVDIIRSCLYGVVHTCFSSIAEIVTTCLSELISTTQRNELVQWTFTTACVFLRQ